MSISLPWLAGLVARMRGGTTCEDGAVTVNWIVLTAAIVAISAAVMSSLSGATTRSLDHTLVQLDTYASQALGQTQNP